MMKKNAHPSIQGKLLSVLLFGLPLLWLLVMAVMAFRLWEEMHKSSDAQAVQMARYLLYVADNAQNTASATPVIFEDGRLLGNLDEFGQADDDVLGVALWQSDKLVMADMNGQRFRALDGFSPNQFYEYSLDEPWRIFYAQDGNRILAVGYNLEIHQELLLETILAQLVPALVGLLMFLLFVWYQVRQGFKPLRKLSQTLAARHPSDDSPIQLAVPKEILPLTDALNTLFAKTAQTLEREKRFTADASHELRTPLAALKLHSDVLEQLILSSPLDDDKMEALFHQNTQIKTGIERSTHLIEQLLTLAKLGEGDVRTLDVEQIDWQTLGDKVLSMLGAQARAKQIRLNLVINQPFELMGNALLLELLLKNLVDNAIRYCPQGSEVWLTINQDSIEIKDNGKGVKPNDLKRLSERFFRPSGQEQLGSGLGLSIVRDIAERHRLVVSFDNLSQAGQVVGFCVVLKKI